MDVISIAILGITAWFLLFGLVYGFERGVFRSVFRLITVGVAFAAAWLGKDVLVEIFSESLLSMFGSFTEQMPSLSSVIEPLLEIVLGVVLFLVAFLVLKVVTVIVYGILSIFIPKGKGRAFGMIVGLVQGALIAFCVCVPINGLLVDVSKLADLDVGKTIDLSQVKEIGSEAKTYAEGPVSKIYTAIGADFYKALATSVNEDGTEKNFSDYVDAAVSSGKLVSVIDSAASIDFSQGLTAENRDTIHQLLQDLDAAKGEMNEETIAVVNEMIAAVVSDLDAELPESLKGVVEDFDMSEISFAQEGEVILTLYDFLENEGETTATDAVNALAESTVILSVVENVLAKEDAHIELSDEATKAEVTSAIAAVEDPEVREQLRNLFGL